MSNIDCSWNDGGC